MYGNTHAVLIYVGSYEYMRIANIEEFYYLCYGLVYVSGVYLLHFNFLMNQDLCSILITLDQNS